MGVYYVYMGMYCVGVCIVYGCVLYMCMGVCVSVCIAFSHSALICGVYGMPVLQYPFTCHFLIEWTLGDTSY